MLSRLRFDRDHLTLVIMLSACLLATALAVGVPSGSLILESFVSRSGDGYSLENYTNILGQSHTWELLLSTLVFAIATTLIAGGAGFYFSWIAARTDAPLRHLMPVAILIPYIIPPSLGAICWIFLMSPTNGFLNELSMTVFGISPFNIYSFSGMVFVESLYTFPLAFTFLYAAMVTANPSYEEASSICGASTWGTFRSITLPSLTPSLISVGTLLFIVGFESFDVAWFVGYPAKQYLLGTEMFLLTRYSYPPDFGGAAVFGVLALLFAMIMVAWYRRVTKDQNRFVAISGKAYRPAVLELGLSGVAASIMFYGIILFIGILPVMLLLGLSLDSISWPFALSTDISLHNFNWVLGQANSQSALLNTLILSVLGSVVVVAFSFIVCYLTVRTKLPFRGLLEYLAFLPFGFPGTMLAVGLIATLIQTPLYGTLWIILLAFAIKFLPYGIRNLSANMLQIHIELEEASFISGAGRLSTMRQIIFPLSLPGLVAAWSLLFIVFARQFSLPAMLTSAGTEVLTTAMFQEFEGGRMGHVAAYGLLLIGCAVPLLILARLVVRGIQSI